MHVLWEEHPIGRFHNHPSYSCEGGVIAEWSGYEFKAWREPKTEALRPPWSEPLDVVGCVALLRNLLGNSYARYGDTLERWPDAIVSFAWQEDRLQIAVIRTKLVEGHSEPPAWFTTGAIPVEPGLTVAPAREYLIIEGTTAAVLWRIQGEGPLNGHLIWPKLDVQGVLLSPEPGAFNNTLARGKIQPLETSTPIEVLERALPQRAPSSMTEFYAPAGFERKQLIVRHADGTWGPAPVWVGEKLTYKSGGTLK